MTATPRIAGKNAINCGPPQTFLSGDDEVPSWLA
jgi:hypothetical protein